MVELYLVLEKHVLEKDRTKNLQRRSSFGNRVFSSAVGPLSIGTKSLNDSIHSILPSRLDRRQSNSSSEMVRTVSAEAARVKVGFHDTKNSKDSNNNNQNVFRTHNRNASNTFSSIGYHELTLIRNRKIEEIDPVKNEQNDLEYTFFSFFDE